MRAMNERNAGGLGVVAGALCALGLVSVAGCGAGGKGADSPGNCPDGTVLSGSDCVPPSSGPSSHSSDESSSSSSDSASVGGSSSGGSSVASSPPPDPAPSGSSGGKTPYDKDSVEIELKRASRQVKANCGSATDDNGTASGPWGKTSASVTLGRNGHIKEVAIPAPYDGQPDGLCAVNAFKKIQFPPYASSSDVVVQWDIEFVKPKH
jgi:hypothetical protein